jgi:hypothetical protein
MVSIPSSDQDDEFEEIPVFGTNFKTDSQEAVFYLYSKTGIRTDVAN